MSFLNLVVSKIKKKEYKLDGTIQLQDMMIIVFIRLMALIRANFRLIGVKKASRIIFFKKGISLQAKRKIEFGKAVTVGKEVNINALSKKGVKIGDNVSIGDYSIISCTGILSKVGVGFSIGKNSSFGEFCYFGSAGGITIGENVIMGQSIRFHSENHLFDRTDILIKDQGVSNKGIKVGDNCWIGAGAVFLDGISIGDGCVIGANSLLNKDIPPNSVVVGNPAKIIKKRE
ncbi:acyltransferase [Carnobacterium divergens]|uniref:acyltransferase n=1 Tax=Carnobacterium divergens TaxID=2748 RepID=UPI0039AF3D93